MDLNSVPVFVRVVETESFTKAASALGVPKSSVSRTITRLEEDLGVRLIQRTTRKLSLTDAGRSYYLRARQALTELQDATEAVSDMGTEPRGVVRITAPVDAGIMLLPELIAEFTRRHPLIHIDVSLTPRVVDLVEEGFDLAVRAGKLPDSALMARKVGSTDIGLFGAASYLKRRGTPKSIAELSSHSCVLFRGRGGKSTWEFTSPSGEVSVEVTGPINVDDFTCARGAIEAGLGIGILPLFNVARCPASSELVRVLPDYTMGGGALYVVSPSSRHQPTRVSLFRDFLIEQLSALRWDAPLSREPGARVKVQVPKRERGARARAS